MAGFVQSRDNYDYAHVHLDGADETGDTEGVYLHELTHAVDAGRKYSDDPKWRSAYNREVANARAVAPQLGKYARESPTEGFAELHRIMVQKGVEETKKKFPKMMAFLEAKGLLK